MTLGKPHVHHAETDSTNARARALAAAGAPHGTLVTAGAQTAGRGRQGRSWTAAPGDALLMSLLVRRVDPLLPLAVAVAVCESVAPLDASIKWPNDVWLGAPGQKVAGILIEGRPQEGWAVIGIGLNVSTAPAELADSATSLAAAGAQTTVPEALDALLGALERWTGAQPGQVLSAWRARDALRGSRVTWSSGAAGSGTAAGITDTGALLVETDSGRRIELDAGEVHLGS